jgi:glycosyltransferase involved in cell wall biosynthesis
VHLRRLIANVAPDVVHLHSSKAGLAGRLALRRRLPTLFQPHGWSWLAVDGKVGAATRAWERLAARWTDVFVCVGEGEVEQGRAAGVHGDRVVVRNGVDLDRFRPAGGDDRRDARALLGLSADVPLAVCPGRLTRQKGQDVLLAAWPAVRTACSGAELALIGAGELDDDLERRLGAGARFHGPVADVRPWLAAADVVVFPSRWEGLSLGLLEAMAVGRSTVVSAIPGLGEAVDDRVGATVPPENPEALAVAIARRLRKPRLARAEGAAAARKAQEFSARTTFDELAAVTERVAGARLPGQPPPKRSRTA